MPKVILFSESSFYIKVMLAAVTDKPPAILGLLQETFVSHSLESQNGCS